jgi:HK97 family phage portal protein
MAGLFGALTAPRRKNAVVGAELGFGDWYGGRSASGIHVNALTALYHNPLLACVNIICEDVSKLPIGLFRRLPNGGKKQVYDHPLAVLLEDPNDWQNRMEWVEMLQSHLLLRGNAYSVILRDGRGRPTGLVPIHPDRVTLFEAPGGEYFFYVSRQGLHEMAVLRDTEILVPQEDVFHLRWMSTHHSLLGTSRIGLMQEAIGLGLSLEQHMARLMGQGARPGGVLTTEQKLTKEVIDRIHAAWQETYAGNRNAGKTAILEGGLTFSQTTMDNVSAEFMASREFQLREVLRALRVPPHKLGLPFEGTASTIVQIEQLYVNDCISTWCDRWVLKLQKLGDLNIRDYFVQFDYEHLLAADIKTALDAARAGVGMMIYTPNDARRRLGLADEPGGDVLYRPTGMVPINTPVGAGGSGPGSDLTGKPAAGDGDPYGAVPGDAPVS